MRTPTKSVALFVAFLLSACSGNSAAPTSPEASLVRGGERSSQRVLGKFKGTCNTTFNAPPQPTPAIHHQTDIGSCNIKHLGRTALYGEQDINFAAGSQSGWRRLTTANGDELHIEHSGTSSLVGPGVVGFIARMNVVGGTGRFANAKGEMRAEGVATLATSSTKVTITSGWITY